MNHHPWRRRRHCVWWCVRVVAVVVVVMLLLVVVVVVVVVVVAVVHLARGVAPSPRTPDHHRCGSPKSAHFDHNCLPS